MLTLFLVIVAAPAAAASAVFQPELRGLPSAPSLVSSPATELGVWAGLGDAAALSVGELERDTSPLRVSDARTDLVGLALPPGSLFAPEITWYKILHTR